MNSVHDMGGMQGFGPVIREENEPVFHAPWEAKVMAMRRILVASRKLSGNLRPAIESLPPADYLRMSYYEIWFSAVVKMMTASRLVTTGEIETGKPAKGTVKAVPAISPTDAAALPFRVAAFNMVNTPVKPGFSVGQQVRARNINPIGHTRLPRYVRGRAGVVLKDLGVQAFPDTKVYDKGDHPQHVYTIRFTARELWGDQASPRDSVYLDLWEDYLEPVA